MFWAMRRRRPTTLIVSTAVLGTLPNPLDGASGRRSIKASRSSWVIRSAGPEPRTKRKSTPASRAFMRTAGDASGFSPAGRGGAACASGVRNSAGRSRSGAVPGGASACSSGAGATDFGLTLGAGAASFSVAAARDFGAVGAAESGSPGASMRTSSAPTASTSPTAPPRASTLPATGVGISTVALSVITAATT